MSNWTHVAGIIRVDDLRTAGKIPDFDKIIGKQCLFHDNEEVWNEVCENPEKFLPGGSEGTLQKVVWINPDKSCMDAYTISIFGDLRDHDDPQEIVDWFKKKCSKLWVRNAVITVENERYGTITYTYGDEEVV